MNKIELLKKEVYREACRFIGSEMQTLGVDDETAPYPANMLEAAARVLRALPNVETEKELNALAMDMYWKEIKS